MKALILIGGLGTRLRPLTCTTPKPLLPLVNKPFLEYQLELLKRHGIKDIIFCVSYLSHVFENHFGSGKKWGVRIKYVHEKNPLGTGGAIKNAAHLINEPVLIFNGDILTDIDLTAMRKFHKQNKSFITIALNRVKDPTIYGLVETYDGGKIKKFVEKPSWDEITVNTINSGVYIFEPEVLKYIPSGVNFSVERGLFPTLLNQRLPLFGYIFRGYWLDIGSVDKYLLAHYDIMCRNVDFEMKGKMLMNNFWVGKKFTRGGNLEFNGHVACGNNVKLSENIQLSGNVSLGNNVSIGPGCQISDSVVLDGTKIKEGTKIEKAVIGKNCVIEPNCLLNEGAVLGDGSVINKYSKL